MELRHVTYFVVAHCWDYFVTQLGLIFTTTKEGNPIAAWIMGRYGNVDGLLYWKTISLTVILTCLMIINNQRPNAATWVINIGTFITLIGSTSWIWTF